MVDGENVKFDEVWTNNTNCYNSTTSIYSPKNRTIPGFSNSHVFTTENFAYSSVAE
jgi:hypothetical protein